MDLLDSDYIPSSLPDISYGMANLAYNQGRRTEAGNLELQVMETRRRVLGPEHPGTLTTWHLPIGIMDGGGKAGCASDGDKEESTRAQVTDQHGQPGIYLPQSGTMGEGGKLGVQVMETRKTIFGLEHLGFIYASSLCSTPRTTIRLCPS